MKTFIFKVTLISGFAFTCNGEGFDIDSAMLDACDYLAQSAEYPEDDIEDVELIKVV